MRVVRTVAELRATLEPVRSGRVGLVPTMGALHDGHLSLLRAARTDSDTVVMSLFVNPLQFGEPADLEAYPRDEQRDLDLAERAGVDLVFAPGGDEMYPPGYATTVTVSGPIADRLEGAHRGREHFDGVATVVTKLLLAVQPDTAYFGAKDAQQVVVVRRLVLDLALPVRIAVCPTLRDQDGLALSSRNSRLSAQDREQALAISRALRAAQHAVADGERDASVVRDLALAELTAAGIEPEYVAIVHPETLEDISWLDDGSALMPIAARVGEVRLIDNILLNPGGHR